MAENCNDQGCEHFYLAIEGTLQISVFEKTQGGAFEATLRNARMIEIEFSSTDEVRVVEDGKTWCLGEARLSAIAKPLDGGGDACDNSGFTPGGGTSVRASSDALYAEAQSQQGDPRDILSLQVFSDFDGAATSPGTYQLDDPDYESCANCLLINTDCSRSQGGCAKTFIAKSGTLDITKTGGVGDEFEAKLTDARLIEVEIDSNTYETQRVEGGENWCLPEFEWEDRIVPRR